MTDTHEHPEASNPQDLAVDSQPKPAAEPADTLGKLMAEGAEAAAPETASPDLEQQAIAAAEAALAEGSKALQDAQDELRARVQAPPAVDRSRERLLRALVVTNLVAMVVLVLLPSARSGDAAPTTAPAHAVPAPEHDAAPQAPSLNDPVVQAFALADRRDFEGAMSALDAYLAAHPRLEAAKKVNVLLALEHYAAQLGDFARAQGYQRRCDALRSAHSLPEDLVQMALEAEKNGDFESMRRHYARLLLQQRQIPSSLYRHVAEAYLKLGDSYRTEAESGEAAARRAEADAARAELRRQAGAEEHK